MFDSNIFTGIQVEYLPPYSPDLNPIEEAFAQVKAFIRSNRDEFAANPGSFYDMHVALQIVMARDAVGYFRHAGYL
jgi:hypothetical protein